MLAYMEIGFSAGKKPKLHAFEVSNQNAFDYTQRTVLSALAFILIAN